MKKRIILRTALTLSIIIIAIAAVAQATPIHETSQIVASGTLGRVVLQLPANNTSPAPTGGNASHPTTLILYVYDHDKSSAFSNADELYVFLWAPVENRFEPVALITDNADQAEFEKTVVNETYLWYPIGPPAFPIKTNLYPNVIQVEPDDIDVWTEGNDRNSVLRAELTKAVKITLPYYNASGLYSNQTFNLPPLTLMFRGIGDPFEAEGTINWKGYPQASNYTEVHKSMTTPAWVCVHIPNWLGMFQLEVTGHIGYRFTYTFIPPPA